MKQYINVFAIGSMEYVTKEKAIDWRVKCKHMTEETRIKLSTQTDFYEYDNPDCKDDYELMRFDFHKIKNSDVVLVNLSNIRNSIGTCDEILYAYINEIPIVGFLESEGELNNKQLISFIHPWKFVQINRIESGKDAMNKALEYINMCY